MEYGIQRRGIYLAPPTEAEVEWFCDQFENREVWEIFGLDGPSKLTLLRHFRSGDLVVGILHRVSPRKRIGFVVMFPPDKSRDFWEFGYAIPDVADRDAFSAMSSTDAMAHYMFEHLHVEAMGWRTRSDNLAASAVVRRLGYVPFETRGDEKYTYTLYRLDRDGWFRRRAKLDRGEELHPSGIGGTFVRLPEFPYEPVPVPAAEGEAAATPAAATVAEVEPGDAPKKKAAPKKAAPKKAAPKKAAPKKAAPKKAAPKKAAPKKAAPPPTTKPAAKKPAPKKQLAAKKR